QRRQRARRGFYRLHGSAKEKRQELYRSLYEHYGSGCRSG
ncbi:Phage-related minor tail protein, partial [Haemophilus influenzae]